MFSQRTQWSLAPNAITCLKENLRLQGETILDLTESNPTRCGFSFPFERIQEALSNPKNMVYEPWPRGMPSARQAVSGYYHARNVKVSPEQIFLTASTSEAYSFLFRLLANPGDEILSPRPSYPLFDFLAGLHDVRLTDYALCYPKNWGMDFEKLEALVKSCTRAVILVNPNNPTGSFIKEDELRRLNPLARKHDLAIISDEVFYDFNFTDEVFPSLAANRECLCFTLGGLSKTLGLPQMKISWITVNGPKDKIAAAQERLEVIADTYLSVNTPCQNALGQWLKLEPQIHLEISRRIQHNKKLLQAFVERSPACRCLNSEGGWYAVLKFSKPLDEETFVLKLLDQDKVFVHPGYFFDFEEPGYAVVSLLPQPEIFEDGVSRMMRFMVKTG